MPAPRTLSEVASKDLLARFGVPFAPERTARTAEDTASAADALGYPVVVKLSGEGIAHKTERGLVRLDLRTHDDARAAADELLAAARAEDGEVDLLVAPMLRGVRELIAGLHTDPQFGACVMVGFGGILAEAVGDIAFRLVPLGGVDAEEMIDDLATRALLGPFRGEPAVDRDALGDVVLALAAVGEARPDVVSVDLNPIIVVDGSPVAVDALVELAPRA